eukprot:2588561-Rhodomonas_salina.1
MQGSRAGSYLFAVSCDAEVTALEEAAAGFDGQLLEEGGLSHDVEDDRNLVLLAVRQHVSARETAQL